MTEAHLAADHVPVRFDAEAAVWVLGESPPGPAGLAIVDLPGGVRLSVDRAQATRIVGCTLELPRCDSASVPPEAGLQVLEAVFGSSVRKVVVRQPQGTASFDDAFEADPAHARRRWAACRLALLSGVRPDDRSAASLWSGEADLLAALVGGLDKVERREAVRAAPALQQLPLEEAAGLPPTTRAQLDRIAVLVSSRTGHDLGDLRSALMGARLEPASMDPDRIEAAFSALVSELHDVVPDASAVADALGRAVIPAEASPALRGVEQRPSTLAHYGESDPADMDLPRGVVRRPVSWSWDPRARVVQVRARLVPGADTRVADTVWARAVNASGVLMALAPCTAGAGAVHAELRLPEEIEPGAQLRFELCVDANRPPLSKGFIDGRRAMRVGAAASDAGRRGDWTLATDLWRRCAVAWRDVGDDGRRGMALAYAAATAERDQRSDPQTATALRRQAELRARGAWTEPYLAALSPDDVPFVTELLVEPLTNWSEGRRHLAGEMARLGRHEEALSRLTQPEVVMVALGARLEHARVLLLSGEILAAHGNPAPAHAQILEAAPDLAELGQDEEVERCEALIAELKEQLPPAGGQGDGGRAQA
jgi:hypothetical protein